MKVRPNTVFAPAGEKMMCRLHTKNWRHTIVVDRICESMERSATGEAPIDVSTSTQDHPHVALAPDLATPIDTVEGNHQIYHLQVSKLVSV
jgi:hypothetical protein